MKSIHDIIFLGERPQPQIIKIMRTSLVKIYRDPFRILILFATVLLATAGIYECCRAQPKLRLAKWRGYHTMLTIGQARALHGKFDLDTVAKVLSLRRDGRSAWAISQRTGISLLIIQEWLREFELEPEENHNTYYNAMASLFITVALGCVLGVSLLSVRSFKQSKEPK